MTEDIVLGLLKAIDEAFQTKVEKSQVVQKAVKDLLAQKADYGSVNDLSVEVGNILASVLQDDVTVDVLPDNKMYYNIANRLLNHTLGNNYQLISDYGEQVQDLLNKQAGIGLKAQVPDINQDRIDGLVEKLVEDEDFDKVKWVLDDPIGLFSQNVVDRMIEANVNFHASVGFKPTITRTLDSSKACKWCKSLAGVWEYGTEPHDIYRKHENCRCQVTYRPDKKKQQDSHTKVWSNNDIIDIIETNVIEVNSGAKHYFIDLRDDFLYTVEDRKKRDFAFRMYETIKNSNQDIEKRKIFQNIQAFKDMGDFSKKDVDIAFDHVFNNIHELSSGKGLFEPDFDMAHSWNRLINKKNDIQKHDLMLLRHERLEHDLMYVVDHLKYDVAHNLTNRSYNYLDALLETRRK